MIDTMKKSSQSKNWSRMPLPHFAKRNWYLVRSFYQRGSTMVAAMCIIAIFAIIAGMAYDFTIQTGQQSAQSQGYIRAKAAADAYADVIYARFCAWVRANAGMCPSPNDIKSTYKVGATTFPAILDTTKTIVSPSASSPMAGYKLVVVQDPDPTNYPPITPKLTPVLPDDSEVPLKLLGLPNPSLYPDLSYYYTNKGDYTAKIANYLTIAPGFYSSVKATKTATYKLVVTAAPVSPGVGDPPAVTVVRYLQAGLLSPFEYARFNNGSLQDGSNNRTYTGPLYAAIDMHLTGNPMTMNGQVNYVNNFYGKSNTLNDSSNLVFQNGAGLRQTSFLELIPGLANVLATTSDANGNSSRANTVEAGSNNFSVRELIEVPVAGVVDPPAIAQKRIYNQANLRVHVNGTSVTISKVSATALDSNNDAVGTNLAVTDPLYTAIRNSISLKQTSDATPFYDSNLSTTVPIKTVDINVGAFNTAVVGQGISTVYVWDDTASTTSAVRFYNGGVLPAVNGISFGTDNMAYIKGDWNTGTMLAGATSFSNGTQVAGTTPPSNAVNSSQAVTASQTTNSVYTVVPSAIFADSVTELSQSWNDANSRSTRNGIATTYNLIEAFGSGRPDERTANDTFVNADSASIRWLENWNGGRRTTSGSEMQLWHSRYYVTPFGSTWPNFSRMDTFYDSRITKNLPVIWGTIVFSRGRYYRSYGVPTTRL